MGFTFDSVVTEHSATPPSKEGAQEHPAAELMQFSTRTSARSVPASAVASGATSGPASPTETRRLPPHAHMARTGKAINPILSWIFHPMVTPYSIFVFNTTTLQETASTSVSFANVGSVGRLTALVWRRRAPAWA